MKAMMYVADEEHKALAAQAVGRAIREGMLVEPISREALAVGMKPCMCGVEDEQPRLFENGDENGTCGGRRSSGRARRR